MGTKLHGLTPVRRDGVLAGWNKRINGAPKWIVNAREAPTPEAADAYYQKHFTTLWAEPAPKAVPVADPMDAPIADLCDVFLTRNRQRVGQQVRGIEQGTLDEYADALQAFCDHAPAPGRTIGTTAYRDLSPGDFGSFHAALGARFGIDRQKKYVIITRSLFKLLAKPPVRLPLPDYAEQFPLPSRKDMRLARKKHKERHGPKLFEPADIRAQLDGRPLTKDERKREADRRENGGRGLTKKVPARIKGAGPTMRAMILLAVNAGFGNTDLSELPLTVASRALADEWADYERPKTGAARLAWLWPETRAAIKAYLKVRPKPSSPAHADLLFLTRFGEPYVHGTKDQVSMQFAALLERLDQLQTGRNFYSLRRTYRSIAAEIGREMCIDLSMGHCDEADDMGRLYTVAELRGELKRIAMHVRKRLLNGG